MVLCRAARRTARRGPRQKIFQKLDGPSRPPQNGGARKSYIPKTGPCEIRKDALKTTAHFWQKCHTGSFSDSRLLREARILHYVPTSRSARIVVKPLHESPGPTTAGASLFCVSFSPRPSPGRPVRLILWSADLAK